ncbi:hypothetical protein EII14_06900 [Alloprevotella sp. OH1205_COT-284]|uniref:hypothetical protein n=1 Tax=Alloprevotella sp. OH1205_COT-284 TaxID=2491043 RepID=UPI000F601C75|nr:hypothetical protein [Alloprevotella sp. OH1205_COT-284]RRD78259.1 hypothetical protein EII14_06900 [Alloprevotella sp. OH1205_COT-284]
MLSPAFTNLVRNITLFQGCESKKTNQYIDLQWIGKDDFVLPSLAFAGNELIFSGLFCFAKAVKAKTNHKGNARACEKRGFFASAGEGPSSLGANKNYLRDRNFCLRGKLVFLAS